MSNFKVNLSVIALSLLTAITLAGCSNLNSNKEISDKSPLVVTTSAITADLARKIGGDFINVQLLVPNGYDSHTYEPKPSEIALLTDADLIVLPDLALNGSITGLIELSGGKERILDLNSAGLERNDLIYSETGNNSSYNPHTWTSPKLTAKWLRPLTERIIKLKGVDKELVERNLSLLLGELDELDIDIRSSLEKITPNNRKLIVYHDAWEYFGLEYDIPVIGAIQAVAFAEPSASELAQMVKQIKDEKVSAFFGSEVFPSDVLEALQTETGARYIPDLADDRLPGKLGDEYHSYIGMMRANLSLLLEGLSE
jgi:manganese/iron transport system substrate-binding protein